MKTHLDLFSGIGGFALACRWNNIQTVGFVEYEDYPRRVLSKQFPSVPLFGDIRDFDATPFRGVDLITGGFPCPPFSVAGKQRGKEDDRYLWPEMLRVIVEAQPRWVLAENVAGLINMALDTVCADLEAEDYATGPVVLGACAKNAPHRRQRIWIIARNVGNSTSRRGSAHGSQSGSGTERNGAGQADRVGSPGPDVGNPKGWGLQGCRIRDKGSEHSEEVGQGTAGSIGAGAGSSSRDVAHSQCQSVRDEGSGQDAGETSSLQGELRERQRVRVDPGECGKDVAHSDSIRPQGERREDHSEGWQIKDGPTGLCNGARSCSKTEGSILESNLGRRTDGLSAGLDMPRRWGDGTWEEGVPRVTTEKKNRTARLKALGNAIVPQIAYELIRCMKEIDESE